MASFVRPHPPFDAPAAYYQPYLDRELREPTRGGLGRRGRHRARRHGPRQPARLSAAPRGDTRPWRATTVHHAHRPPDRPPHHLARERRDLREHHRALHGGPREDALRSPHVPKVLPYEGSAHVPFIVRVGSRCCRAGGPAPRTSDAVVDLMDVMPTLLDLAGVEVPGGGGRLLAQGGDHGARRTSACVRPRRALARLRAVQPVHRHESRQVRLVHAERGRALLRPRRGPREERDLSGDPAYAERVAELRAILIEKLRDREEGYVQDGGLVVEKEASGRARAVLER